MSRSSEEGTPQKTGKEGWIPRAKELCSSEQPSAQCWPFVAGMYLQGRTWMWLRLLREESLLKAPQQLHTLSQPSGPASLYLRTHPHGSNRVCRSVREVMDGNVAVASCAYVSVCHLELE